jgi:nicotinamidase-related amidase
MKGLIENQIRNLDGVVAHRTAVLAVHWQTDVVAPEGVFGKTFAQSVAAAGVIPRTAQLLDVARDVGAMVIYVNVQYWPDYVGHVRNNALFASVVQTKGFIRGTPGVQVIPQLAPKPGDAIVEHSRISSFYGSDLLNILIGNGIETVIVTGVATNVAIDHTVRDAVQYGYRTILVEDCCCSSDPAHHEAALMTMRVLSTAVLKTNDVITLLRISKEKEKEGV